MNGPRPTIGRRRAEVAEIEEQEMEAEGGGIVNAPALADRPPGPEFGHRSLHVFRDSILSAPLSQPTGYITSEAIPVEGNVVSVAVRLTNTTAVVYLVYLQGSYDGDTWVTIPPSPFGAGDFGWSSYSFTGVDYAFVRLWVEAASTPSTSLFDAWVAFGSN